MRSWTENRLLMASLFAVFLAVSSVMLAVGDSAQRIVGAACLVFFGGLAVAWWLAEFRTGQPKPAELRTVPLPSGRLERALVLPMRAGQQRTAFIAATAVTLGSLIFALSPETLGSRDSAGIRIVLLVVAVVTGLTVIRLLWARTRPRDFYVALTPSGILVRAPVAGSLIPWAAITTMEVFRLYNQPFLGIDVVRKDAIEGEGVLTQLDMLDGPLTGHDRSFPMAGFGAEADAVEQVIRDYYDSPAKRAGLGRDAIPPVLLTRAKPTTTSITTAEKRHARSAGRWIPAFLLGMYGLYICAIAVGTVFSSPDRTRTPSAVAATVVLALIVLLLGVAHFAAAAGIARRREIGRRIGIALSSIGTAIGGVAVVAILLTELRSDARAWGVALLVLVAYSVSLVMLVLVGNLSALRSPPAADREPLHDER